ncbi:MAG: hypothetical protein K8F52_12285 [Candidatus Scalindua rubra]|nr:hypothetical protein [Candidatus Scalindua rubra]
MYLLVLHGLPTVASFTIKALGVDTDRYGIIRFSFGLPNTREDVKYLFKYLPQILKQLKEESAVE